MACSVVSKWHCSTTGSTNDPPDRVAAAVALRGAHPARPTETGLEPLTAGTLGPGADAVFFVGARGGALRCCLSGVEQGKA